MGRVMNTNEPFPLDGGRAGMGVSAGRSRAGAVRLSAQQRLSLKLSGHTPTQPSPIEGEGGGSSRQNNKNSGGNHMSLTKSTTRRVALFTSSSLVAAGIAAAASLGLALTPTAAAAQAVCSETQAQVSDAPADTVTCPVGTYPAGINYTSTGDLSVSVQMGGPSTFSNFGTGGIVGTAGTATDDVTLRLIDGVQAGATTSFNTPFPALLNAQSQSGDVLVEVEARRTTSVGPGINASNAATSRAIRAVSTAGGDVVVRARLLNDTGVATGGNITSNSASNPNAVAIEARSVGGGDVTVDLAAANGTGRLYGILAQADGDGDVTIRGSGLANTLLAGSAGLRVVNGTGDVDIVGGQLLANNTAFTGRTGVYVQSGGDVTFTGMAQGTDYGIDLANVAAGTTTTLNLVGGSTGSFTQSTVTGGIAAIRAAGAGEVLVNISGVQEPMNFDFTGMSAPVEVMFKEGAIWRAGTSRTIPAGNFNVTIEEGAGLIGGVIETSAAIETPTVITFADPNFVLTNEGFIIVGPQCTNSSCNDNTTQEAELRLEGLNEFRHSGVILLGSPNGGGGPRFGGTRTDISDGSTDDILSMPGVHWVGEGGRVLLDVDFTQAQSDCERDPDTGSMAAADCLRLVGGTTEGVTYVTINEVFPGDRLRPAEEGIVLVEVTGGTSAQGHFAVDPNLPGFTPLFGGSQDRGLYHYVIGYNEDTQQHTLFGFLGAGAYQFAQYASATQTLWRTSTGSWLDRQADLRAGLEPGVGGGVWMRASGEITERDTMVDNIGGGRTFTFDNSHEQTSYAITGGLDLINASQEDMGWVAGLMAGYATSEIEYEAWTNTGQLDGFSIGGYSSFIAGGLFVDAALNATRMVLENDLPGLNIFPAGSILDTVVVSLGGQVEAGYRFPVTDFAFVEPLASVSYVRSIYDDLEIAAADPLRPGVDVEFDDPRSLRASIGGRAGLEQDFGVARTQFSVVGRMWNEFEGDNRILIHNQGATDIVADDFSGQFREVGLGASVYSPGGAVSGFLNLGGKFGDDYQARIGSVGVRVAW